MIGERPKALDSNVTSECLALILADGSGARLAGLTAECSKSAVPFGAHFRAIDFTLSNCINSGLRRIALLTQYKSQSLIRHVRGGWGFLHRELDEFIDVWPAQQRQGERWYAGTADAIQQNLDLISAASPEYVLIMAGDHVYSMDYSLMLEEHITNRADVTLACVAAPLDAGDYETLVIDERGRVRDVASVRTGRMIAGAAPGSARASMGVYAFNTAFLLERLAEDAADQTSAHALGSNILPAAISGARVFAHTFHNAPGSGPGYWRDIATVDSYWQAHMELLGDSPKLDLFDDQWPFRTHEVAAGPTRIQGSIGLDAALLGRGCSIAGEISHSVLSTNCQVAERSRITNSVLLPNVQVGANCVLDGVIVETGCTIPDNTVVGSQPAQVLEHYVSPRGIVLISRSGPAHAMRAASRKVA